MKLKEFLTEGKQFKDFNEFLKACFPNASKTNIGMSDSNAARVLIKNGAKPQKKQWFPASPETAKKDFGSEKDAGYYFYVLTKEDGRVSGVLHNGSIHHVSNS